MRKILGTILIALFLIPNSAAYANANDPRTETRRPCFKALSNYAENNNIVSYGNVKYWESCVAYVWGIERDDPNVKKALAIMWSESKGIAHVRGRWSADFGLMQINYIHTKYIRGINEKALYDPIVNLRVAKYLYDQRGWQPWYMSAYRHQSVYKYATIEAWIKTQK